MVEIYKFYQQHHIDMVMVEMVEAQPVALVHVQVLMVLAMPIQVLVELNKLFLRVDLKEDIQPNQLVVEVATMLVVVYSLKMVQLTLH